jgi:hypothetical protein
VGRLMPSESQQNQIQAILREASDLSVEVVVLLIYGVFMLLFGLLMFKINTGELPYSPDSTYGLFLVLVSFQVIALGKTPFGDLRRSWALIILGMFTAMAGMAACFIPGYFTGIIRPLVGIILLAGGIVLFIQLCISENKARLWLKIGGILGHLTMACALVYALGIILGLITLCSGAATVPQTAVLLMVWGISFIYLSWCIWKAVRTYGPEQPAASASSLERPDFTGQSGLFQEASLPLPPAILILLGVLFTFLGLLLLPVIMGWLPFSPDGQLGLLLIITAIQVMALGDTPIGHYRRSWFMIVIGLVFAALGAVSCIVPGLLTGMIRILLGVLNIMGGAAFFIRLFLPKLRGTKIPPESPVVMPPVVRKLGGTLLLVNTVTLAFGLSMLLPGLLSGLAGLAVPCLLVVMGLLLFRMAFLMQKVKRLLDSGERQIL